MPKVAALNCWTLSEEPAQSTKPLSTSYAGILSALDLAEVVTKRPDDGVTKREVQNFAAVRSTGNN